jgi:hypothetical protein
MKGFVVKYALPLLMLLVALHQFFMVYRHHLSRWKGGGFGMYSEIHPMEREVWIGRKDSMWLATDPRITTREVANKANRIRYMPNEKKLLQFAGFAAKYYGLDSLRVELWQPALNPANHSLKRILIREVHYAGKP